MDHADVTVLILAGGRSTRMGQDKAQVPLGGISLLTRAADVWRGWGAGLMVSVGAASRQNLVPHGTQAVYDRFPDCGPLGGLHGGLAVLQTAYLLLCAVDCPFLEPTQAEALMGAIGDADACVYSVGGRTQPLFGLYRAECLASAEDLLRDGCYRMQALLSNIHTVVVAEADEDLFQNLNTPDALRRAEEHIQK